MAKKVIGKLEKPAAKQFKAGRKLYFIPLIKKRGQTPFGIYL